MMKTVARVKARRETAVGASRGGRVMRSSLSARGSKGFLANPLRLPR